MRFVSSSSRTRAIEAAPQRTCVFISRKNSRPRASRVTRRAFSTIIAATAGNVSPPRGMFSAICRSNFASISSTSATRSRSFDAKCQ